MSIYTDTDPTEQPGGKVQTPPAPPPSPTPTAPPTGGSGVFGVDYKPWETIDTTVSQAQWKAWENFRDPNCPKTSPYRSERGEAGCFEKPVDCPDGKMPGGPGNSPCVPNPVGGGGGGAGGAGGGGAKSRLDIARDHLMAGNATHEDWVIYNQARVAQGKAPVTEGDYSVFGGGGGGNGAAISSLLGLGGDMSAAISGQLSQILNGATRFSPEVVAGLTANNKQIQQAQVAQQTQAARESAAARGVIMSPVAQAQENQIQNTAAAGFSDAERNVQLTKAATDFTDKMAALKAAQDWLTSLRSYAANLDQNNVQRQGIEANLELGYARIAAETQNLMAQLAANKDMLGMQLDQSTYLAMQKLILCAQTGNC